MGSLAKRMDKEKAKRAVLGLMYLTTFKEASGSRTWKAHDWEILDELHEDGYIGNPKSKVRSVDLTDKGAGESERIFEQDFCMEKDLAQLNARCADLEHENDKLKAQLIEARRLGDKVRELLVDEYKCLDCHETFKVLGSCDGDHSACMCEGHCPHCGSDSWTTTY